MLAQTTDPQVAAALIQLGATPDHDAGPMTGQLEPGVITVAGGLDAATLRPWLHRKAPVALAAYAARNCNDPAALRSLLGDPRQTVRVALCRNEHLTVEQLDSLYRDAATDGKWNLLQPLEQTAALRGLWELRLHWADMPRPNASVITASVAFLNDISAELCAHGTAAVDPDDIWDRVLTTGVLPVRSVLEKLLFPPAASTSAPPLHADLLRWFTPDDQQNFLLAVLESDTGDAQARTLTDDAARIILDIVNTHISAGTLGETLKRLALLLTRNKLNDTLADAAVDAIIGADNSRRVVSRVERAPWITSGRFNRLVEAAGTVPHGVRTDVPHFREETAAETAVGAVIQHGWELSDAALRALVRHHPGYAPSAEARRVHSALLYAQRTDRVDIVRDAWQDTLSNPDAQAHFRPNLAHRLPAELYDITANYMYATLMTATNSDILGTFTTWLFNHLNGDLELFRFVLQLAADVDSANPPTLNDLIGTARCLLPEQTAT
jgi:hypothetical protein